MVLFGCSPSAPDPGIESYERFVRAIAAGDAVRLWSAITPGSRADLAERLCRADQEPTCQPSELDATSIARVLGVRRGWGFEVELLAPGKLLRDESDTQRRVVEAVVGGVPWRVVAVLTPEGWGVDLAESGPYDPATVAPGARSG